MGKEGKRKEGNGQERREKDERRKPNDVTGKWQGSEEKKEWAGKGKDDRGRRRNT